MKMPNRRNKKVDAFNSSRPSTNQNKKSLLIVVLVIITAGLIVAVYQMGQSAMQTVDVAMLSQSVYKNQQITAEMIQSYPMVQKEFDSYATRDNNGTLKRRILLYEEAMDMLVGSYAAYSLQANTLMEYRSFYKSKVDNSDSVLYKFPGKEIVSLDIGTSDLETFKTFLEPGDRITITALYNEEEKVTIVDDFGGTSTETTTHFRTEQVFEDIVVADLLNQNGESVLDIYEDYNGRSIMEQARLDSSQSFQDSVVPKSLIVALTPEELEIYYYYLSKSDVEFKMSLPQRVE